MDNSYCVRCRVKTGHVNPWIDHSKNGRVMIKSLCPGCGSRKATFGRGDLDDMEGEGIKQTFDTIRALLFGQFQLPPEERELLKQVGNLTVKGITVYRIPINVVPIDDLLNFISAGQYQNLLKKYSYDTLFHLFAMVTLENGTTIKVEKNERINIERASIPGPNEGDRINVPVTKSLSLNQMLQNTEKVMGKNFYSYNPVNNNCQTFISNFLKGNGLLTAQLNDFINQKVGELLGEIDPSGELSGLISGVTRLGTVKDILFKGGRYW